MANVLVLKCLQKWGNARLVNIMNNAGRLIINWISRFGESAKCSLMIPNAGAMAAPAITVSSDIDSIDAVRVFATFFILVMRKFNLCVDFQSLTNENDRISVAYNCTFFYYFGRKDTKFSKNTLFTSGSYCEILDDSCPYYWRLIEILLKSFSAHWQFQGGFAVGVGLLL